MSFSSFFLSDSYDKVHALGDRLGDVKGLIDWSAFVPLLSSLYDDDHVTGGRPHTDEIVLIKMLILQQWYSLSDAALEKECYDRLSFQHFLDFPSHIPDRTTIWKCRERIIKNNADTLIWSELQRQLDERGLKITRGTIQDATFITSDPGHARADKPRGGLAQTRRSKDGTWAKKGKKSFFGYKMHSLLDKDHMFIRRMKTTTASLHDSQVDLSERGETVYRDKGYFGVKPKASMDKTMKRAVRNKPLSEKDKRRNKAISRVRSRVEYPFAVIKRTFQGGHELVTTVQRVHVKNMFACVAYNLFRLETILNPKKKQKKTR
jgi:Transposase and inactivated derivatives, IS5 family